jgi:hypothetical protein
MAAFMRLRILAAGAVSLGALSLGLTGCGSPDKAGDSAAPPAPSTSGTATGSASPSSTGTTPPGIGQPIPSGSAAAGGEQTLVGEIQDGVEPNCTLLRAGDKLWLLVGGDRTKLKNSVGTKVSVRGAPAPGMMTTCQQGTPFKVTDVQPAS